MILINKIIKNLSKPEPLVKIHSHPRSGTHFLEAFLAKNFYPKKNDLGLDEITWGHWSDRRVNYNGNPFGKLFGNHYFADKSNISKTPKIYIYRDGRAVAYSIWKTPNFLNREQSKLDFNDFLLEPIDWFGSTSRKTTKDYTIFEHWFAHVNSWKELATVDSNLLIIRYEDLLDNPFELYKQIHSKYFSKKKMLSSQQIDPIKKPVGLLPNEGVKDAWVDRINTENLARYNNIINYVHR